MAAVVCNFNLDLVTEVPEDDAQQDLGNDRKKEPHKAQNVVGLVVLCGIVLVESKPKAAKHLTKHKHTECTRVQNQSLHIQMILLIGAAVEVFNANDGANKHDS